MVCFPVCKINLGLHVLSRRTDGYHDIETCFYPVPLTDVLEIIPSRTLSFASSGVVVPGQAEENLCLKAYHLLENDFKIPPVEFYLHKIIPVGAGLGGGSSDAAFTLSTLTKIFKLPIDRAKLNGYAARLGSDCSFFLDPRPMMASGRGEILQDSPISLRGKFMVLVTPGIHVSTRDAYLSVTPGLPQRPLSEILRSPITEWKSQLHNDFEASIFNRHPLLQEVKDKLYSIGAVYASMSGSGSSVYGLFDKPFDATPHFPQTPSWSALLD